jgi:hypothetical protein
MELIAFVLGSSIGLAVLGYHKILDRLATMQLDIDVLLEDNIPVEPLYQETEINLSEVVVLPDDSFKVNIMQLGDAFFINAVPMIVAANLSELYIDRFNELGMYEYSKAISDKLK